MGRRGRSLLLLMVLGTNVPARGDSPPAGAPVPPTPIAPAEPTQQAAAALPTEAEMAVDVISQGNSTRSIRDQAKRSLPWAQLTADQQRTCNGILSDISLFRRLPTVRCTLDPRVYEYFLECPDVAVGIWRVLGISHLQLKETAPLCYEADTGDGSTGTVKVLLRTPTQCVAVCDGMFKSPMLPKAIKARALVSLTASMQAKQDGTTLITHSVDMFVQFPSLTVETIAKMVSPLSYKYADRNIEEITSFMRMMNLSMERQPGWIEQICLLMEGVDKDHAQKWLKVTAAVYVDAERKSQLAKGQTVSVGSILPPVKTAEAPTATATK